MIDRFLALSSFGAALLLAAPAATRASEPACQPQPIAVVRNAAQARRAAGDPAGAWKLLEPFIGLGCLDSIDSPNAAERSEAPKDLKTSSDYAWLLDDAYVYGADKRFGAGAPETAACIDLLRPLANDDLVAYPWMSPALRQATSANIKACAAGCGTSLDCVPFRATAWGTYTSKANLFRKRACVGGAGQRLDDGRCIELRGGNAGLGFTWSDVIKGEFPTPADEHAFCPALYLHGPGSKEGLRLDLPTTSALRDGSRCCAIFGLSVRPGTSEFAVSATSVPDCNGGTARTIVEEIYSLPPDAGAPTLLRDNGVGLH